MAVEYNLPVNLGNPYEFTMLELAQTVLKITGSSSSIEYKPLPQDDPRRRRPDISRAKALLDWEPKIQLEDGLLKSLNHFRSALKNTNN
jgi:UDP-glucuronate decarboxylase